MGAQQAVADPPCVCATCDSPDNLQNSFGGGGLNDVCLGCFYIWYDGPTERYWDEDRRREMTSGESMRRASLLAKVTGEWPYNGSQLPLPTPEEAARAAYAMARPGTPYISRSGQGKEDRDV